MKKLSFLIAFLFLYSFSVLQAEVYKNTIEEMSLKGTMTSLSVSTFNVKMKGGKSESVDLQLTQSYKFDSSRNATETVITFPNNKEIKYTYLYEDGRLVSLKGKESAYNYTYDEKGNRKEELYVNKNGKVLERTEFTYDKNNRCIRRITSNEMSRLASIEMKYDANGNLCERSVSTIDGEDTRTVYTYNDKNLVEKEEVYNKRNRLIRTYTYSYKYDSIGNWIQKSTTENDEFNELMEREFKYDRNTVPLKTSKLKETIVSCIVAFLCLCMIAHMLYVIYKGKRYKMIYTCDYFTAKRNELGLPLTETPEEIEQQCALLEEAFNTWSIIPEMQGEYRTPTKMKQIKSSTALLDQVIAMNPLDFDVIKRLNELTEVINTAEARSFSGSKTMVVVGFLFAAFLIYVTSGSDHFFRSYFTSGFRFWGPVIVYILASRKPQFLIDKKLQTDGGGRSLLFASLAGLIGSAHTIRTVTKWSDGTKTVEDNHDQHLFAWMLTIIIMMFVVMLMWVWAILNYLRNYVFYY